MGQSYLIVNLDKKEYIHPHAFGDGQKLLEFGTSATGTMSGLAILLADGNGNNGGDIKVDPVSQVVGRWAGDRVVVAGQYAKEVKGKYLNHFHFAKRDYTNISNEVLFALMADAFVSDEIRKGAFIEEDVIKDFTLMHKQLAKDPAKNMALLVGRLKSNEGKSVLEKFLKRT